MTRPTISRSVKPSLEIVRLAAMAYVRSALSLRNVEGLLHERGIGITQGTVSARRQSRAA